MAKDFFKYQDDNLDQKFSAVLNYLESLKNHLTDIYGIQDTYNVEFIDSENTTERSQISDDGDYPDIDCHWIVKIKDKMFLIPGNYSSWEGIDHYWNRTYEVIPNTTVDINYKRKI